MQNFDDFLKKYIIYEAKGYDWKLLDDAIFNAVDKYPGHRNKEEVAMKIELINRVYRANIQMSGKGAEGNLAEYLVDKNTILGNLVINPLKSINDFNKDTVSIVTSAHKHLNTLIHEAINRNAISFASKYLNFHFPEIIPIYDSWSCSNLKKLISKNVGVYNAFCEGILSVVEALKDSGINNPSIKLIDVILYRGLG